ncbi:hypothetical protein ABPG77_008829 [Micractinium sp. CCAP 211/92]
MSEEYDLVTIGAGSGGVRASRLAAGTYGAKVAIIELPFGFVSSEKVGGAGGTCVIRGCVPKKLFVYASSFADEFADAEGFGWAPTAPPPDVKKLIARKAKEIERLNGVYNQILSKAGVEIIEGRGVVLDPHTVEVRATDGSVRQLKTKNILIATGGRAVKPKIPGAELGITSDEALVLDNVPAGGTIAIIGAGYIAVEFAGIFRGLGYDVHLIVRGNAPLRGFDEECRQVVAENLAKRGVTCRFETNPTKLERNDEGGIDLHYHSDAKNEGGVLKCAQVMFATGRAPNTRGIGLEDAGVKLDEKKKAIKVDEYSHTNVPSIWAIGDCTDRLNLTPVALMEGKALAATLFGGKPTVPDYENVPSAVFAQPPLGTVGLTEQEAVERLKGDIDVYISKFKPMKNTMSGRDERTFMKMIVHVQTGRVVGCHMVGPDAAEIIQGLGVALKCNATKAQFDSCVGVHPSAAEEWVTMSSPARRVACTGEDAEPTAGEANGYKDDN